MHKIFAHLAKILTGSKIYIKLFNSSVFHCYNKKGQTSQSEKEISLPKKVTSVMSHEQFNVKSFIGEEEYDTSIDYGSAGTVIDNDDL